MKGGQILRFKYELIKALRNKKLKMSQTEFIHFLRDKSKGVLKMQLVRWSRFENGKKTNVNPTELGFIMNALGEEPNTFFSQDKK